MFEISILAFREVSIVRLSDAGIGKTCKSLLSALLSSMFPITHPFPYSVNKEFATTGCAITVRAVGAEIARTEVKLMGNEVYDGTPFPNGQYEFAI